MRLNSTGQLLATASARGTVVRLWVPGGFTVTWWENTGWVEDRDELRTWRMRCVFFIEGESKCIQPVEIWEPKQPKILFCW